MSMLSTRDVERKQQIISCLRKTRGAVRGTVIGEWAPRAPRGVPSRGLPLRKLALHIEFRGILKVTGHGSSFEIHLVEQQLSSMSTQTNRPPAVTTTAAQATAPLADISTQTTVSMVRAEAQVETAPRILLLGDGDFGFACSVLPNLPPGSLLTVTSFEDHAEWQRKYSQATANLTLLTAAQNVAVQFGVDARTLAQSGVVRETAEFDVAVFNFPRTSLTPEVGDSDRLLVLQVLMAAARILSHQGLLLITLRDVDVQQGDRLALQSSLQQSGMRCVYSFPFCDCKLTYGPKMTNTDKAIPKSNQARTYVIINPKVDAALGELDRAVASPFFGGLVDSITDAVRSSLGCLSFNSG